MTSCTRRLANTFGTGSPRVSFSATPRRRTRISGPEIFSTSPNSRSVDQRALVHALVTLPRGGVGSTERPIMRRLARSRRAREKTARARAPGARETPGAAFSRCSGPPFARGRSHGLRHHRPALSLSRGVATPDRALASLLLSPHIDGAERRAHADAMRDAWSDAVIAVGRDLLSPVVGEESIVRFIAESTPSEALVHIDIAEARERLEN